MNVAPMPGGGHLLAQRSVFVFFGVTRVTTSQPTWMLGLRVLREAVLPRNTRNPHGYWLVTLLCALRALRGFRLSRFLISVQSAGMHCIDARRAAPNALHARDCYG